MIYERKSSLLLTVLELKYGGHTTHDVLTYSTKAERHKEIYPYLRYGLVVGGLKKISNRFFTHNRGFGFAYALKDVEDDESWKELADLLKDRVKNAYLLLDIFKNKIGMKKFNTRVEEEQI